MGSRRAFIERTLRQIYNGMPTADSGITENLVNSWMSDAIGLAAKKNYTDNYQMEGVGVVNNSFYTTFKGLALAEDERNLYKTVMPDLPLGMGATEGISRVVFKDSTNTLSYPAVLLSENQVAIYRQMRPITGKIICYPEGKNLFAVTSILMSNYTASVTLVSGGDPTDLDSELNVPADYYPVMVSFIQQQLILERKQMPDLQNDGRDN